MICARRENRAGFFMPDEEWDDYADPNDIPDDPDDWRSESDED